MSECASVRSWRVFIWQCSALAPLRPQQPEVDGKWRVWRLWLSTGCCCVAGALLGATPNQNSRHVPASTTHSCIPKPAKRPWAPTSASHIAPGDPHAPHTAALLLITPKFRTPRCPPQLMHWIEIRPFVCLAPGALRWAAEQRFRQHAPTIC